MIKEWFASYDPKRRQEAMAALREIMLRVALAGLSRTTLYEMAAFCGGTALRIFHGLDRFSEDLEFSLLTVDPDFSFSAFMDAIIGECRAQGMDVSIGDRAGRDHS